MMAFDSISDMFAVTANWVAVVSLDELPQNTHFNTKSRACNHMREILIQGK